jgi:hypothetical protein
MAKGSGTSGRAPRTQAMAQPPARPVPTSEKSRSELIADVNRAHFAWEEAMARGAGRSTVRKLELRLKHARAAYAHERHRFT